ncbi:MAG: hypothetical protein ACAI44_20250 [Candidatus Sericytochromatia bacterium]
MRLSYASLFPHKVKNSYCKRKRLGKDNPYSLPAGDYCLYDLYPLSGVAEPDIYFTLEYRKDPNLTATLRCLLYRDKAEVMLSPEHLQSQQSPDLCRMVQDMLNEDASLRAMLRKRKQEVQLACQSVALAADMPETSLLSETAIRKLAGTLEQVLASTETARHEVLLDQLLADLKAAMLQAFAERAE